MTRAQELHYAQDRESVLTGCLQRSRRKFRVPAQMLDEAIRGEGYTIEHCSRVQPGVLGYCNVQTRRVVLPQDFAHRLDFPSSWRQVMRATLAHELGHIRLHSEKMRAGMLEASWEDEANLYAQVFLVPREQLQQHPALDALLAGDEQHQRALWRLVLSLANHFKVSRSFMVHSLRLYGWIEFDRDQRWIRLPQLVH